MSIKKPKGTADIFGRNSAMWQYMEDTAKEVASLFDVGEIRTPMFEFSELFRQSVGEGTDIVQKEMYTFTDQGGRDYVLKPEGTAGVVRAYLENSLGNLPSPAKFYYITPIFRAERPQKGRQRQHHQFGVEYFGSYDAATDAEVISLAHMLLTEKLGIEGLVLRLNSIGDAACRLHYNEVLLNYLNPHKQTLCELCGQRMAKNPMRVLDCKNEDCKAIAAAAPLPLDHINDEATQHFSNLKQMLTDLNIPFIVDKTIVRGLDYYSRTVFEFTSDDLGSQSTVCGGGRYDGLVSKNGGKPTGAVGFGMGIERLLLILEAQGKLPNVDSSPTLFLGHMGDAGATAAIKIAQNLRKNGIATVVDLDGRNVKSQLKYADKIAAKYAAIIGDTEIETGKITVKSMADGNPTEVEIDDILNFLQTQ